MTEENYKRKLAAILSADVAGYSRLMGDDEAATVQTLEAYKKVMFSLIKQHRGRVIDSPGDNLLAEFTSIVDAVQAGVAIQKELRSKNAELPDTRKMEFRIGINLGDVVQEGDHIYGDGVNIAARLEGLAEPGGICISKTAFDYIESKLPYGYEYLGEQTVKNIARPVGAYRVSLEPRVTICGKPEDEKSTKIRLKPILIGAVAVIFVAIIGGLWPFSQRRTSVEQASIDNMAYPLPDKPSVAVLPFVNMSDDPEQEYFSDGLTEEIITALSKVPKLFVIARNSVFTYKGKPVKIKHIAEELGVRYVLEGSIRKAGSDIRITAQLIDALTGHHLWAERYDRNLNEIFAVQDDITKNIITAMQVELTEGEQARAIAKGTNDLEAYLKYLQAVEQITQYNVESNALAKQLAQEAIAFDPEYATAYRVLATAYQLDVWLGTSKSPKQTLAKCIELLEKAISLDETNAEAHSVLAWIFAMKGEHDKAVAKAAHAVMLNPNSAFAHANLGQALRFAGRWNESIPEYKKAIRLNPIPPAFYFFGLGMSYSRLGQHEEAIKWCQKAVQLAPDSFLVHLFMTSVYSRAGRQTEARSHAAEVMRLNPQFSVEKYAKKVKRVDRQQFIDALRRAGLK
ncbi:Adenylate cyclase (EC [Olavius algarvensis associated proteobacterium Delta 3]|nr:Adenylate cyclase (EC [Olavius algarvensis associated proteobacterium Delta 3]